MATGRFNFNFSFPVIPILVPTLAHLVLVSFALLTGWPLSFFFTHVLLVLCAFWASQDKTGWQPVVSFIVILVVSAITDIVALGVYFPGVIRPQVGIIDGIPVYAVSRLGQFSAAMVIINLLGKPLTLACSVIALFFRRESFNLDFLKNIGARDSYDSLHGNVEVAQE